MVDITEYIRGNHKYYIYGTTSLGKYIYEKIVVLYGKASILGFVETEPIVKKCMGKNVFAPTEIGLMEEEVKMIIASATHFQEMKNMLNVCGIMDEKVIIPYKVFDFFKTLYGIEKDNIRTVCFWPPINEKNQDIIKKINWFIPDRIEVNIWCDERKMRSKFNDNICIKKKSERDIIFKKSDLVFLWNVELDGREYEEYISKVFIVDPKFYYTIESLNYCKLYYNSFSGAEKKSFEKKSKEIYMELKKKIYGKSLARIFCSGPAIDEIYENRYEDSINIICNSMVKDRAWLKRIKPDVLAFTDLNYYFSPTEYCEEFYEDVLETQRLYGCYIVVYDYEVPLLLAHHPELSGKIIGITDNSPIYAYPSEENLKVRCTKNILTETMIPLASSLCDEIEIAGATGRNPDENFYWKHYGRMQYLDLMSTIFEMYPSVFRDQNYANYYEYHCQCVEELLEYGEKMGKKYRNLTTSYIPALDRRTVRNL